MGELLSIRELSPRETALAEFANWWDKRLVAKAEEFNQADFFPKLELKRGYHGGFYTLVTHYCHNQRAKDGIEALGGMINIPDYFCVGYGRMAANQIRRALGIKKNEGYGDSFDGFTHVWLHQMPYELYDTYHNLYRALNATPLALAFSERGSLEPRRYEFEIEKVIQAPWEGLTVDLTETEEGRTKLKYWLQDKVQADFNDPRFVYRLRRLENKYLIAVI